MCHIIYGVKLLYVVMCCSLILYCCIPKLFLRVSDEYICYRGLRIIPTAAVFTKSNVSIHSWSTHDGFSHCCCCTRLQVYIKIFTRFLRPTIIILYQNISQNITQTLGQYQYNKQPNYSQPT